MADLLVSVLKNPQHTKQEAPENPRFVTGRHRDNPRILKRSVWRTFMG
jgi:hypothetical protein